MRLLVLPTQEDQANVAFGSAPENHFDVTFDTDAEAEAYVQGIGALGELAEYEVVNALYPHHVGLTLLIDGEEHEFEFATEAERDAFQEGLAHGDGFISPDVYWEGQEGFAELESLLRTESLFKNSRTLRAGVS